VPAQLAACGSDAHGHSAAGTRPAVLGEPSTFHAWGHVTNYPLMCVVGYLTCSMNVTSGVRVVSVSSLHEVSNMPRCPF